MKFNICVLALMVASLASIGGEGGERSSTSYVRAIARESDQVCIIPEHRVENRGPRCFWSVMETLARHNKISQLYGLTDKPGYENAPSRKTIRGFLNRHKVRYEMQWEGNYDTAILRRGCDKGLGVAICIVFYVDTPYGPAERAHMMTLVSYTDRYVRFIDPNKPNKVQEANHTWFRKYWDGLSIVLYPN